MTSLINRLFGKKTAPTGGADPIKKLPADLNSTSNNSNVIPTSMTSYPSRVRTHLDLPQLIIGAAQSVGVQRDHNEDSILTLTTTLVIGSDQHRFGLFLTADGMGGHENGEIASSVAVSKFSSHILTSIYLPLLSPENGRGEQSIQEIMLEAMNIAHRFVKEKASGGGTTLTAALILDDQLTIAHIGDSRAYKAGLDGKLVPLTHDHSVVDRLVKIGQITPEQAAVHPQRNMLYRALGQVETPKADITTQSLQAGNQILLCSDGLWGVIPERDMEQIIHLIPETQAACQMMVDQANEAGGPDNISVILVKIPE